MSRFSSSLLLSCLTATTALAQTAINAPHSHATEAVNLEHFVITASPFERAQADLAQATTILAGDALSQRRQTTLGDTLAGLPGLNATAFGPGASRPIVRGLGGDRVRVLENGVGTLDASVVSPDHAVSVEPFLIDRIEVVRGPASLLYGGSAVGGVVNVLTHRIEREVPDHPVSGRLDTRFDSAADERSYGGVVNFAVPVRSGEALVLHLDGFRRDTGDLRIPGYAESASLRAEESEHAAEHDEDPPEFARGTLPNSAVRSRGGAAGLSWVTGTGHLGFASSGYDSLYGIPGHGHAHEHDHEEDHADEGGEHGEDVRLDLRQRRWDVQGETRLAHPTFSLARVKFGHSDYEHRELEGDEVGTVFRQRGWEGRAELLHRDLAGLAGTWGVQLNHANLAVVGDEAFLPAARTRQQALFAFEEFRAGDWTGEFGARFERADLDLRDGTSRGRSDDALSLSAGTVWNPAPGWTAALSLVRSQRAPNVQEAYAYGPHIGTNAFEVGDATLARERALGLEASLRKRAGRVTGELTLFAQRFRGFIYERASGLVAHEHDGAFELVDPATLDDEEAEAALPVLAFGATDARFRGAEAELIVHLHDEAQHRLDLRLAADLVRAEDGAGRPLPRIPAQRYTVGLAWQRGDWSAGAEWQQTARQGRTVPGEDPSAGYGILHAYLAWCLPRGDQAWDFFVRGTNLTDKEARPHTSFLRDLAPLPGRNVAAGVRWSF